MKLWNLILTYWHNEYNHPNLTFSFVHCAMRSFQPRYIRQPGTCCTMVGPHRNDIMHSVTAAMWQIWMLASWGDGPGWRRLSNRMGSFNPWWITMWTNRARNGGRETNPYVPASQELILLKLKQYWLSWLAFTITVSSVHSMGETTEKTLFLKF